MSVLRCFVYKCARKRDAYVYLPVEGAFDALSVELRDALGRLEFVMAIDLWPERKLARAEASQVIDALRTRGFYLQMPPPPGLTGDA